MHTNNDNPANHDKPKLNDKKALRQAKKPWKYTCRGSGVVAVLMIALDWTPERCRQRYRKRLGVETSYRLGNKQLGWTTSPNPAYRFVLIGRDFCCSTCGRICAGFTRKWRIEDDAPLLRLCFAKCAFSTF
jgi:hypothetical protein